MIHGFLPKAFFRLLLTLLLAVLTACSGGTGTGNLITGSPPEEEDTGTATGVFAITLGLDTNGDRTDAGEQLINDATPGILFATVTLDGALSVGTIVQFSLAGGVGEIVPASGSALTGSSGVAAISLTTGTSAGATSALARIIVDGSDVGSDSVTFSSLGDAGDAGTILILTLTFNDATPGNQSNIITSSEPATVAVLLEDGSGQKLPSRSATIATTLGTISVDGSIPALSTTGVTDLNGAMIINLAAGAAFGTGTVTVTIGGTTENVQFEVGVDGLQIGICSGGAGTGDATDCSGGATFTLGDVDISVTPLSAGGTSSVSLVVVDAALIPVSNIEISFTSGCVANSEAEISESLTSNNNGIVSATYLATGCVGPDLVTASEASAGLTATGFITVLTATIGSISFDSVTPNSIQIKGTGTSSAIVIFQVSDVFGDPVEDASVDFELTTTVGGLSLVSPTGLTNSLGKAVATVNAGFIPTTVRVRATVFVDADGDGINNGPGDFIIETLSDGLSVNTGVPDQNSMSISAKILDIEGENFDGVTTQITILMSDAFNNPVPNGTSVQFRTEYGSIQSNCSTQNGGCTVTLTSSAPRRPTDPNTFVQTLLTSNCPTDLIVDETVAVTISPTVTDVRLDYVPAVIWRVERASDSFGLIEGAAADYTVVDDGIDCVSTCTGETDLLVTYTRAYLDEDSGIPFNDPLVPDISNPGVATEPFAAISGIPCLAAFRSPSELTSGYLGGLGQLLGVRSTVLAFSQGEESFIDTNGNGQYDFNEEFVDLPEAFHDLNEDGVFGNGDPAIDDSRDAANPKCYGPVAPLTASTETVCYQDGGDEEVFIDFGDTDPANTLKDLDGLFNAGNGIYNGTLCPDNINDRADTCNNNVVSVTDPIADPCDEATEQYCTRDLINIRRDIVIILSGSGANFSVRDFGTYELIGRVDLSVGGVAFGRFQAGVILETNDGSAVAASTDFDIGFGPADVAPGIGEIVSLISGSGSVIVHFADDFNGRMATGTTVTVTSDTDGCVVNNAADGVLTDSNSLGPVGIGISLSRPLNSTGGGASIRTEVVSVKGIKTSASFFCEH